MWAEIKRRQRDYAIALGLALAAALLLRSCVVEVFRIPSDSMRPTLEAGDTLFVQKWAYRDLQKIVPERGDVLVFKIPEPDSNRSRFVIKRVIGIAGDTIEIREGLVVLNGKELSSSPLEGPACIEEQLPGGKKYGICREPPLWESWGPKKVGAGEVFAVSDLRSIPIGTGLGGVPPGAILPISGIQGRASRIWVSWGRPTSRTSSGFFPQLRIERFFRRVE